MCRMLLQNKPITISKAIMEVVGETGDRTMIRIMHWEIATVVRQIGAQEVEAPMLKLLAARHGCKVLHHDEKLLLNI